VIAATRRAVIGGAAALAVAPAILRARPTGPDPIDRIGMTTVCLRDRIAITGLKSPPPSSPLSLLDAPQFIRDTFGLRNIEVWSLQFEAQDDAYCTELRRRAEQAGCRIVNIQVDGGYDLSSPNPAVAARSQTHAAEWVRRGALLGSPTVRINPDSARPSDLTNAAYLVPAYRALGDFGRSIGVGVLIENHIGRYHQTAPVADLLREIRHPNVGAILDWGNSDAADFADRMAAYRLLFPWLRLVSAKGLHFTPAGAHVEYPIAPIVRATEASGFRGIYSIELFTMQDPPDPRFGVRAMTSAIRAALVNPAS
jgi:sugar phosphate isomerase/epimerase